MTEIKRAEQPTGYHGNQNAKKEKTFDHMIKVRVTEEQYNWCAGSHNSVSECIRKLIDAAM